MLTTTLILIFALWLPGQELPPLPDTPQVWLQEGGFTAEELPEALSVATCESHLDPNAENGNQLGLFQLMGESEGWQGWFRYFGVPEDAWSEPIVNAFVAKQVTLYDLDRGYPKWSQWPVCGAPFN